MFCNIRNTSPVFFLAILLNSFLSTMVLSSLLSIREVITMPILVLGMNSENTIFCILLGFKKKYCDLFDELLVFNTKIFVIVINKWQVFYDLPQSEVANAIDTECGRSSKFHPSFVSAPSSQNVSITQRC